MVDPQASTAEQCCTHAPTGPQCNPKMGELKIKKKQKEPGTVQTQSRKKCWLPPNGNESELGSLVVCARRGVVMGNPIMRRCWPPLPCLCRCHGGPVTVPTAIEAPSPPRSPSPWRISSFKFMKISLLCLPCQIPGKSLVRIC